MSVHRKSLGRIAGMDITRSQHLIEMPEADPAKLPAYYLHVENVIAWCMDEIFRLAKSSEDDEHKMKLVALEYRARLVLERFRKRDVEIIGFGAQISPSFFPLLR